MTVKELASYIGKVADKREQGYTVSVCITDARVSYGQVQVQINPRMGTGFKWVNLDSLTHIREGK